MKTIKVKFVDGFKGFIPEESCLFKLLSRVYDLVLCEDPDYVICQPYGHEHLKYDCVKIFVTGENVTPDFNLYDYAIAFDHLQFGDRYLRVPNWAMSNYFGRYRDGTRPSDEALLERKFCSFVVSNMRGDQTRIRFFNELSKYKRVDSGGRCLNNIGHRVDDKLSFVSRYKFNIAFENSAYPGYSTEKIMDPLAVWSVPIYWGDPLVGCDFNSQSYVDVRSFKSLKEAVDRVVYLDEHDDEYLRMCKCDGLVHPEQDYYSEKLFSFLRSIFDQPIASTRRISDFGCQGEFYRPVMQKAYRSLELVNAPFDLARKVKRFIRL